MSEEHGRKASHGAGGGRRAPSDPAACSPPGEACRGRHQEPGRFWRLPGTSPSQGVCRARGGREVWAAPLGKLGEGGGLGRWSAGMASSGGQRGCQWGLPVDAWSPGSQEEAWAHPALPAPPPSPCHPPPCRPPEQKAEAGRAVLTGRRLGPRLRMWPPNSSGQEDATPGTDRHLGGSWVQELGSAQALRTAELSRCSAELSPGLRQSPPSSPRFSKNEAGSSQKKAFLPTQKSVQASTPPLPNRHPARCGEPCGEGDWGKDVRGLSLLHLLEGPQAGKAGLSLGRGHRG